MLRYGFWIVLALAAVAVIIIIVVLLEPNDESNDNPLEKPLGVNDDVWSITKSMEGRDRLGQIATLPSSKFLNSQGNFDDDIAQELFENYNIGAVSGLPPIENLDSNSLKEFISSLQDSGNVHI